MALQTPVVTVERVTEPQSKLYKIEFRMVATDDTPGLLGLDENYTSDYKLGLPLEPKITEVITFFQKKIDRYENSMVIRTSAALETARSDIESGLVVT